MPEHKEVPEEVREQVDAHIDEIVVANVEDVMEDIDITEALTDEQIQDLFDAFEKEDWEEVDRIIDSFDENEILNVVDKKAGGADRNRGGAEKLRRYWTRGPGGAKIGWGSPGDWTRCVSQLSKYLGPRAKGYCALRHKEMNGYWPGDRRNKNDSAEEITNNSIYHESKQNQSADLGELMLEHKTVGVKGMNVVSADEGIVETIISVTGIVDNVKDRIMPGAYQKTLVKRKPKGVWSHDWDTPVSKTLDVKELMPGDPELPGLMPNGDPWPGGAGALKVKTQFNLETQRGREAYSDVVFFGEEQEWSIGYNVPVGGAKVDQKSGVREITMLELYEYSPVLFGAMPLARTTSVKEAQMALKALKGGAAAWLAEDDIDEEEKGGEYTSPDSEEEIDEEDEMEGKRELAADQMILVKRAIETLSDLLEAVQVKGVKGYGKDKDKDKEESMMASRMSEKEEDAGDDDDYDSLVSAVKDIVTDDDVQSKLVSAAEKIDGTLGDGDQEKLDDAMSAFLDVVEESMGGDSDEALRDLADILADMIDQMNEADGGMPEEEDMEKKPNYEEDEDLEKKRDYSEEEREKMAESGMSLPDGSYPIRDKEDLGNAIQAFGRAKDKEKAKKHIMKRARELDAEDMIPENWTEGKTDYINLDGIKGFLDTISD
jgi:hypothetical protein